MKRKILINFDDTELRVAFLEDGELAGLRIEPYDDKSIVGNLYKGRVEGVVPSLKAVFVDIGAERNAFLHFSDVRQEFLLPSHGKPSRLPSNAGGKSLTVAPTETKKKTRKKKGQQTELKVGDTVVVQVSKDEINDKGPRITTNISLPGRFLVYLPYADHEGGVSRRIEDGEERKRLRQVLQGIKNPNGGFIIRTAGLDQSPAGITADVRGLHRQWRSIRTKAARSSPPALVHNDHDLLFRLVRDTFRGDEDHVIIDDEVQSRKLERIIKQLMPESKMKASIYKKPQNLFEAQGVEEQIQKTLRRKVWLKSGGSIIIEETEAMTTIDVNSGKYVGRKSQEDGILKVNLEAAAETVRQLQLRDIGGIICVDFIDMIPKQNQETLHRELGVLLKNDRAKTSYTNISEFGVIEITRQRVRQSLRKTVMAPCPHCEGEGRIKSSAQIWRNLKSDMIKQLEQKPGLEGLDVLVHPEIRKYLEEALLAGIKKLANRYKITLTFNSDGSFDKEVYKIKVREKKTKPVRKMAKKPPVSKVKSTKKAAKKTSRRRGRRAPSKKQEKKLEPVKPE